MIASPTPDLGAEEQSRRFAITPAVEALVVAIAIVVAITSYLVIVNQNSPQRLIPPPVVALILVANLVSGVALMMLLGRRVAMRRAARSAIGGGGRLHVRLVGLFSIVAAVPMLLVAIFASLLFQYGVQFWYSDRARGMLENATVLARTSYDQQLRRWEEATVTMADDMSVYLRDNSIDPRFASFFFQQVYYRSLSEGALFAVSPKSGIQTMAIVNPYAIDLSKQVTPAAIARLKSGRRSIVTVTGDRIQTLTALPGSDQLYLYAARVEDTKRMTVQTARAEAIVTDYRALLARARSLQLQFNAALLFVSLFIVGISVWIALAVADRLVRPVEELVAAARRVAGGDLRARVPDPRSRDEVGTLAKAFNQMTIRLEEQNTELVTANDQLENRRALIEAVMAGVSAGVIATAGDGTIRLANQSATSLIGTEVDGLVGHRLAAVAPELAELVAGRDREAIVQVSRSSDTRTLAVRIARTDAGPILTFDDITQQVLDQRRAAWSDVARRIAHEIKNPLTPIQLAAERLQRRYGSKIDPDDTTFARLTDTIVRQVGDLRRMVDEFSSFARMPKPVFREESVVDIARQAMFLHEVAHSGIAFELVHDDPGPVLVCDRRQLGQAFTNIVKNAVEAIESKGDVAGTIVMTLNQEGNQVTVDVADTGIGLPAERDRIVEPYMTTRARGTGLGLAIVKKIVEEHLGTISFFDREGGGAVVRMCFDAGTLATFDMGDTDREPIGDGQLAALTRNRTMT
ncbi:ATP-binding protein [uncultured Sphingomonas sp.]|uniref:sensor histidine kinase n=1 Tax=uncultured Sphingomonas sp. TaxID=158754 RepID=UPI0035CBC095